MIKLPRRGFQSTEELKWSSPAPEHALLGSVLVFIESKLNIFRKSD